jgi:excisionase family DNA binding protein
MDKTKETDSKVLEDALTVAELAVMLKLHPITVRLKASSGEIPGRKIGNRWRFSRTHINEWLAADRK